jgi:tetratricopeptide (TPR) repeat protein
MEQALAQWRELQDKTGISWEMNLLANLARAEGDLPQARTQLEESVALRREIGDRFLLAYSLRRLAEIALLQGDYSAAESYYREAHSDVAETGGKAGVATSLAGFAGLALAQGQAIRAVRLYGAAQSILQALNWRLPPADEQEYERALAKVHQQLDEPAFKAAWEEGRMLSIDQAIAYALSHVAT